MTDFKKYNLPDSWEWTTVDEIGIVASGGTPSTKEHSYWDGEISWVSPADLTGYTDKYISIGRKSITLDGLSNSSAKLLPKGSVLFSSRAPIGYTVIAKGPIATNQGFKNIIPTESLFSDYIYHYLKGAKHIAEKMASGTTFLEISGQKFSQIPVPFPPINEQHRIVSKIEELFSDLDNGVANLKKAQNQLKSYRQALLKNAFEGKITEQWRKENNTKPAEQLLRRIQAERQKHYEQELEDWKVAVKSWEKNGKEGKKPGKPRDVRKVLVISEDDYNILPPLPKEWKWEKLGNVCLKIMDGTHFSPKNHSVGEYMYVTAKNIKEGKIVLDNISYVSKEDHKQIYARCDVKKDDVLYIKDGATTGIATVNKISEEFSLLSSVAVFRTFHNLISPKFLEQYLNSEATRKRMLDNMAGVAITRLTLEKLNHSIISICSPEEQTNITEFLDENFSIIDNLRDNIKSGLKKSEALRQLILKKAFEGKLVEQNPYDEPAAELLKRIKAEKQKYLEAQKQQNKKAPKKIKKMSEELSIEEVLKTSDKAMLAKDVWQQSKHKDSIEDFYKELKKIQGKIEEIKKGTESLLSLIK